MSIVEQWRKLLDRVEKKGFAVPSFEGMEMDEQVEFMQWLLGDKKISGVLPPQPGQEQWRQ